MTKYKGMDMPESVQNVNLGYLMTMEIMKTNVLSQAAL